MMSPYMWLVLLLAGATIPAAVMLRAVFGGQSMFHVKALLLTAEYGLLLPVVLLLVWKLRCSSGEYRKQRPSRNSLLLIMAAYTLLTVPLAAVLGLGVYQSDEGVYLFEAHGISAGNLYMPAPPAIPSVTGYEHDIVFNGKWFGKFPYGWPAVLALGGRAHLEWLVNPLFGLLLLWLTYKIGEEILSPEEAHTGALFLLLSAFFTANCIGFMSHPACGALIAAATLCYFRFDRSWTPRSFALRPCLWLAGMLACIGAAAEMRQFTALCAAAVLGLAALWRLRRDPRGLAFFAAAGALLGGLTVAFSAWVNYTLVGDYFRSLYAFTPEGVGVSLRPADLLDNIIHRTPAWIGDTLAVSFPFLFLLAGYALWRRRERNVWILGGIFILLVVGHLIELGNSDSPVGGRYYFEGFFGIALLGAAGWRQLTHDCNWDPPFRRALALSMCAVGLVTVALFHRWEFQLRWPTRQLTRAIAASSSPCGVVFLPETRAFSAHRYNMNRPGLKDLLLIDVDPQNRRAIAAQLGKTCWSTLAYDPAARKARWHNE
jgi:hypothetical protein